MNDKRLLSLALAVAALGLAATAHAQTSNIDHRWSADFGIGWDHGVSGNINSSAMGRIDNQVVVILKNSYQSVYGTGLHIRFGGGVMIDEVTEVRATFIYQSLNADLTPMGDIGTSKLYGQYDKYQMFGLDAGFRRYVDIAKDFRAYGEGTLGLGFIDELDVVLAAPTTNVAERATDFYDRTAAFTLGGNFGLLWQVSNQVGVFGQVGLRWVTGLSAVDGLAGTGLEKINDNSSRWTLPIVIGVRARF
jgi:hypothetical protein